jgi:hypothetical protein
MCDAANCTAPNWIDLNQTMQSQTMTYITKSSYEISALLRYYAVLSSNSLPMFANNLLVPSSKVKKSKMREKSINEVT